MYTQYKSTYRLVFIAGIVMLLLALFVQVVDAKKPVPNGDDSHRVTTPHQNPVQGGRPITTDCHSRHARQAGIVCGENGNTQPQPPAPASSTTTATNKPTKIRTIYKTGDPLVFLPVILKP